MGVILSGIFLAAVLAVGAGFALRSDQPAAWQVFRTQSTRVGDPGENLVGKDWTGQASLNDAGSAETNAPAK
jgi:hypothetical protein